MNEKVNQALEGILARFESGEIPEAIAYSIFPGADIPSAKWSLMNRILMYASGTRDARGFRQWNKVGRHVKKGAKAFHILAPRIVKKKSGANRGREISTEDDGIEEFTSSEMSEKTPSRNREEKIIVGFLTVPVFRVEDTEGQPLDYENLTLPPLPLSDVAESWGVPVKAIPGNYRFQGFFNLKNNEIALATEEETVFFHELAHVAHQKLFGKLQPGQDWKQEIVAELSAAALCKIVGKTSETLGNSFRYISGYAEKADLTPVQACLKVIKDVEGVLGLILNSASQKGGNDDGNIVGEV